MDTIWRGKSTEAAMLHAFLERGWNAYLPFGEGGPSDLVIENRGRFLRVQCKTGREYKGCLLFNSRSTDHGKGPSDYRTSADIFGVYLPSRRRSYLVPTTEVRRFEGRLRLEPALNNQRKRIRLAVNYEIDRWSFDELCARSGLSNRASKPGAAAA